MGVSENLDPFVALWSMCNALRRDRLPDRRVVIRFDFTGFRLHAGLSELEPRSMFAHIRPRATAAVTPR